jgi:uncharacterized protein YcgL (UPF0745 family)
MNFEDAMNRLRNAVLRENKVPTDYWAKGYPALQRFFDLLSRQSLSGEDVKAFEEILEQQGLAIRELFFDATQTRQLDAMREIFGETWPMAVAESRKLYDVFSSGSTWTDELDFKAQGRSKIDEFNRKQVSKLIIALWCERTGTESPDAWSRKYATPSECLLLVSDAKGIVDAIANPSVVSAEHLQSVYEELKKDGLFLDLTKAEESFVKRVLPTRYQKIGFVKGELSTWLCRELGDAPDTWLTDARLHESIEAFIKQSYAPVARKRAAEKVNMLSDTEAKKLLIRLVDQVPDAGLWVLE